MFSVLKVRFGLGQIDKDTYDLTLDHLNEQMIELNKELNGVIPKISNLEKLLSQSLEKLQNLSKIWDSSNLDGKRILQKTLFPEGVFNNSEKHQYLTRNTNKLLS